MPRRRPAQLRASQPIRRQPGQSIRQVSRVSAPTLRAIADVERTRLQPGVVAEALGSWAGFVRGPARALADYAPEDEYTRQWGTGPFPTHSLLTLERWLDRSLP